MKAGFREVAEIGGESATIFDTELRGRNKQFKGLGGIVEDIFPRINFINRMFVTKIIENHVRIRLNGRF